MKNLRLFLVVVVLACLSGMPVDAQVRVGGGPVTVSRAMSWDNLSNIPQQYLAATSAADSSAVIQAAIDANHDATSTYGQKASTGRVVLLGPGTFTITSPVYLRPGVTLAGSGKSATTLTRSTAGSVILLGDNAAVAYNLNKDSRVSDIWLKGTSALSSHGVQLDGTNANEADYAINFVMEDVNWTGGGYGYYQNPPAGDYGSYEITLNRVRSLGSSSGVVWMHNFNGANVTDCQHDSAPGNGRITAGSTMPFYFGKSTVTGSSGFGGGLHLNNCMAAGASPDGISLSGMTVTVSATNRTFVRSAGDFVADGVKVNQMVTWGGFTNSSNNCSVIVTSVTTDTITCWFLAPADLTAETSGAAAVTLTTTCDSFVFNHIGNITMNGNNHSELAPLSGGVHYAHKFIRATKVNMFGCPPLSALRKIWIESCQTINIHGIYTAGFDPNTVITLKAARYQNYNINYINPVTGDYYLTKDFYNVEPRIIHPHFPWEGPTVGRPGNYGSPTYITRNLFKNGSFYGGVYGWTVDASSTPVRQYLRLSGGAMPPYILKMTSTGDLATIEQATAGEGDDYPDYTLYTVSGMMKGNVGEVFYFYGTGTGVNSGGATARAIYATGNWQAFSYTFKGRQATAVGLANYKLTRTSSVWYVANLTLVYGSNETMMISRTPVQECMVDTAAPTTGTWNAMDPIFNSALGAKGWTCLLTGTPGSWSPSYVLNETLLGHAAGATLGITTDVGLRHTNTGSSGTITLVLPAATVGLEYHFTRIVAQIIRIDPNGAEVIQGGGAGKYLSLDTDGASVTLKCVAAGVWQIIRTHGTTSFEG